MPVCLDRYYMAAVEGRGVVKLSICDGAGMPARISPEAVMGVFALVVTSQNSGR